jgi:hypothetical protein
LYNSGNFKLGAVEYERIYYLSEDVKLKNLALLKKSYCYKQDKKFEDAAKTLKRIDFNHIIDSIYALSCYEYALNTFLNGDYSETMLQLDDIEVKIKDTLYYNQSLFLKILTLNKMQKWEEANTKLNIFIKTNKVNIDPFTYKELMKIPKLKNENFAQTISYIIPGGGQMYTGQWGRGLSSLILQGAFVTYTYFSFINGFYISGVFSGFSTFRSFWTGGANYAKYLAKQKNKERIDNHNKKVKDFLLKNFTENSQLK